MDELYIIDEIFRSKNVKVKSVLTDTGCLGCYFWRLNSCFKPAFVGACRENGQRFIFVKIH